MQVHRPAARAQPRRRRDRRGRREQVHTLYCQYTTVLLYYCYCYTTVTATAMLHIVRLRHCDNATLRYTILRYYTSAGRWSDRQGAGWRTHISSHTHPPPTPPLAIPPSTSSHTRLHPHPTPAHSLPLLRSQGLNVEQSESTAAAQLKSPTTLGPPPATGAAQ